MKTLGTLNEQKALIYFASGLRLNGTDNQAQLVATTNAAVMGPVPFGTPFTILCALTLMSMVVGPFAAGAMLRHGLE